MGSKAAANYSSELRCAVWQVFLAYQRRRHQYLGSGAYDRPDLVHALLQRMGHGASTSFLGRAGPAGRGQEGDSNSASASAAAADALGSVSRTCGSSSSSRKKGGSGVEEDDSEEEEEEEASVGYDGVVLHMLYRDEVQDFTQAELLVDLRWVEARNIGDYYAKRAGMALLGLRKGPFCASTHNTSNGMLEWVGGLAMGGGKGRRAEGATWGEGRQDRNMQVVGGVCQLGNAAGWMVGGVAMANSQGGFKCLLGGRSQRDRSMPALTQCL